MRNHLQLGRIFGIEIGLHYSWALIAIFIALSLVGHFGATYGDWSREAIWASALLTTILFFSALVAHEMAHALVAKAHGLQVKSITLFALGGVAQIEGEARTAKSEFLVAVVGPLASALIGVGCLTAAWAAGWPLWTTPQEPVFAVLVWLGYINFSLAAFNMVPAFPLDGGRILRSVIWWITGGELRSMRLAARAGRGAAVLLMAAGLLQFAAGAGVGGLWLAFIGLFLFEAANASYAQARLAELLHGLHVGDLMIRDAPRVDAWTNLQDFVEENPLRGAPSCFIVLRNGEAAGLIGPREIRQTPQPQWRFKTVADVMRPLDESPTIAPEAPIIDALETMGREDLGQLLVTANGRIEGVISRAGVAGFLQARSHMRP